VKQDDRELLSSGFELMNFEFRGERSVTRSHCFGISYVISYSPVIHCFLWMHALADSPSLEDAYQLAIHKCIQILAEGEGYVWS